MMQISRATHDDLSDLVDNAPVGIHLQGEDGSIRHANRALAYLLGCTREQLTDKSFTDFYSDMALAADHLERLRAGEVINSAEVTLVSFGGATLDVLVSASALCNDGRFIHARVFTREIPALRHAMNALAQADARKAAILDASLDAIITMDADGRLLDFNRAAESIFGYRRQDAINCRLSELIIPPRLRAAHEAGLRRFLDCGIGPVIGRRIEVDAMRADGQEFPVELSIAVVQGAPPMFTATLRDITRRLTAERELQDALRALQQSESALREADRRKDEFITTLAHELRNPLAPVRTAAEILARRKFLPERTDFAIDVIQRQVAVMSRLLDDLLDVARIARGKLELRKESVVTGDVLRLATQTSQPMLDAKSQRLELQSHMNLDSRLWADPVRLAQVLVNLLNNASKYSDPAQVITLRCSSNAGSVIFEVEDRGIGFTSAQAEHLFDQFTQLPGSAGRAQGGLGVGLAIARSLMQLHGGTLEARSLGPGLGATFKATLPLPAS